MRSPAVGTAAELSEKASVWARRLEAACLVLFPLLLLIFAGTDLHPDPFGETAADQVRTVAASAGVWQVVHLVLAAASLLGIGALLGLRRLIPSSGRRSVAASIAAALGVMAAGLVAGIMLMEAVLVAPLAKACAASSACLSPATSPSSTSSRMRRGTTSLTSATPPGFSSSRWRPWPCSGGWPRPCGHGRR